MNQKNNILLSAIGLVVLTALAATGATFAWFTTTRNVSVSYSSATVASKGSHLIIDYKSSLNTFSSHDKDGDNNIIDIIGLNSVTDISGDGLDFYKPVWSSINDVASSISQVGELSADGYYIDFTITISRDVDSDGMTIFLGPGTEILPYNPLNAKDVNVIKSSRMAVINYSDNDSDTGTPSLTILHAPYAEVDPEYLVKEEDTLTPAYGTEDYKLVSASELESHAFLLKKNIAEAEANYTHVADLMEEDVFSADVTFRFWIEGSDDDAINGVVGGVFKVNIDLYALEA